MSSAGFKVPDDVMAPLIFVVCVPTLLLLFYSLCFPEHVDQLFGSGPLVVLKPILEVPLETIGVKWTDVEPILQKLSFEDVRGTYNQEGISGVLKLMISEGGDGAKQVILSTRKALVMPTADKLGLEWDSVHDHLTNLPLEELQLGFTNPKEFAEMVCLRLAPLAVKPVVMPMLNAQGFEWEFFEHLLVNQRIAEIQAAMADPISFVQGLAAEDLTAARIVAIMDLQAKLEVVVVAENIKWKEAVSVMCSELVSLEQLEASRKEEHPEALLAIIFAQIPLREDMEGVEATVKAVGTRKTRNMPTHRITGGSKVKIMPFRSQDGDGASILS